MGPSSSGPSPWTELFIGASGNLIGGFGATLLWWMATCATDRRRLAAAISEKRKSISLEIAKLRAWLKLLEGDATRASTTHGSHGAAVLSALVRLGPDLGLSLSLEPQLGELEHRIGMVDAANARLFASTTGPLASAMRGNEKELEQLRTSLSAAAKAAVVAVRDFEVAVVAAPK